MANLNSSIPQTREDWKKVIQESDYLINMPEWYKVKMFSLIPRSYEREWIVSIFSRQNLSDTLIGYIYDDGKIGTIGCMHCLDISNQTINEKELFVDGVQATPMEKIIDKNNLPPGMQLFEISYLNLFVCPYCNQIIKHWARGVAQDPTLDMSPDERKAFINKYVR